MQDMHLRLDTDVGPASATKRGVVRYQASRQLRPSGGFTMIEMILAIVVLGIIAAIGIPSMSRALRSTRVNKAASVLAGDFELAFSTAARLRRPVRVVYNSSTGDFYHIDRASNDTVFTREFGSNSPYDLQTVAVSPSTYEVFPNGLASGQLTATLTQDGYSKQVIVTRAGQVRIN